MAQFRLKLNYWGYSDCALEEEGGIYLTILDNYNKEVWASFWINTKGLKDERYLNELRDQLIDVCHDLNINCNTRNNEVAKWEIFNEN